MDYANNQRQTVIVGKYNVKTQQYSTEQNNSENSSCFCDIDTKSTHWFQNQKRCFILFWIHKFLQCPSIICSFYAPLSRNKYFKEMSDLISNQLGKQYQKTPSQCKTRFNSIKRKVKNQKAFQRAKEQYDFFDYIVYQAKKILKSEQYQNKSLLRHMIYQIESLKNKESETMILTKKIIKFQQNWQTRFKNNCIYRYLQQHNQHNKV